MKITRLPKKKPKNKIILDRNTLTMIKAYKSNSVDRCFRDFEQWYNRQNYGRFYISYGVTIGM